MYKKITTSQKSKLKLKLKVLDNKLSGFDGYVQFQDLLYQSSYRNKMKKLDEKRKKIRNELKGYSSSGE